MLSACHFDEGTLNLVITSLVVVRARSFVFIVLGGGVSPSNILSRRALEREQGVSIVKNGSPVLLSLPPALQQFVLLSEFPFLPGRAFPHFVLPLSVVGVVGGVAQQPLQ